MAYLPEGFDNFVSKLLADVESIEGYLSTTEIRFLALLGACPTARGEILEIGSFKGRSTIILAKASALAGDEKVNAVDPMIAPSETDPDLGDQDSSFPDFQKNIETAEVVDRVAFNQMLSSELAAQWEKPLRLLWIDGDHTYRGTKQDIEGFERFLEDGAIVAIHDVLHAFDGGVRVFIENMLLSPNYGACGCVGSIAWAQYHSSGQLSDAVKEQKLRLYNRMSKLVPYVAFEKELKGMKKTRYKILRSRVPHGPVDPQKWLEMVAGFESV